MEGISGDASINGQPLQMGLVGADDVGRIMQMSHGFGLVEFSGSYRQRNMDVGYTSGSMEGGGVVEQFQIRKTGSFFRSRSVREFLRVLFLPVTEKFG